MAMQKITFSADADLLDRAEQIAKAKGTTLEEEVRQWLNDFGEGSGNSVIVPEVVIRPMNPDSMNQRLPSGPVAIPLTNGLLAVLSG